MKKALLVSLGVIIILSSLGIGEITEARILSQAEEAKPLIIAEEVATHKIISPYPYFVRIISPNGGEIWNRNKVHEIKWSVMLLELKEEKQELKRQKYFKPRVSIDLFKKVVPELYCLGVDCGVDLEKSVFVKHIATVDMLKQNYYWDIPDSIKNGNDYVVRVSALWYYPSPVEQAVENEENLENAKDAKFYPRLAKHWDESDFTFTITGKSSSPSLEEVIKILEEMSRELIKVIQLLREVAVKN